MGPSPNSGTRPRWLNFGEKSRENDRENHYDGEVRNRESLRGNKTHDSSAIDKEMERIKDERDSLVLTLVKHKDIITSYINLFL